MKTKTVFVTIVLLLIATSTTQGKSLKDWTAKTVWQESNGWTYAVGKAYYNQTSTAEFLNSQNQATIMAINLIKQHSNLTEIKGFQIIDFEYSSNQYYVLAAIPNDKNQIKKINKKKALPWEWDGATMFKEP